MTNLEKLMKELGRIEAAVLEELQRAYPVGTKVLYRMRGGKDADRYPWQEGEVVGYANDGRRLRVKLALSRSAKVMGYTERHVETIPISKIKPLDDISGGNNR